MWDSPSDPRPPFLRSRLGAKLRRMRAAAKLTLDEAAALLDLTRSSLHRIETGETKPTTHLIRSMMDVFDCHDTHVLDEVRAALQRPWYQAYGVHSRYYVDAETEAAVVRDFSTLVVPELLQTEEYSLALLKHWNHPSPYDEVIIQRIRQQRLTSKRRPLRLTAVIDEMTLRRNVGGPDTMQDQLRRLIDTAASHNVIVRVLPAEDQSPCAIAGSFTLLTLPRSTSPDLLHIGQTITPLDIEDPKKLSHAHHIFKHLQAQALDEAESISLIERALVETRGRHPATSTITTNNTIGKA